MTPTKDCSSRMLVVITNESSFLSIKSLSSAKVKSGKDQKAKEGGPKSHRGVEEEGQRRVRKEIKPLNRGGHWLQARGSNLVRSRIHREKVKRKNSLRVDWK